MAVTTGIRELIDNTNKLLAKYKPEHHNVQVGYRDKKALWVHEAREMKLRGKPRRSGIGVYWGPRGRAGFLLDVALEMRRELVRYFKGLLKTHSWKRSLWLTAYKVQRESQKNVPVEHGDLTASAFTKSESR